MIKFAVLALTIASANSNPLIEDEQYNKSYLIVKEMTKSVNLQNEVPTDCFIDIITDLNKPSTSLIDSSFTIGANFCSSMGGNEKQALALGLTKCHMQISGKSSLVPEMCREENMSQGANEGGIYDCLSNLPQTAFLIYSQFFTHTELMCIKLTEDLRIHQKNKVLDRFEENVKMMGVKFESIQNRFDESGVFFDRFEESAKLMDDKIENIANIERAIDDKIESVDQRLEGIIGKTIKDGFDHTAKSIAIQVYHYGGLEYISKILNKLKQRGILCWSTLAFIARLTLLFAATLFTFASTRFRRSRKFIFLTIFTEMISEHIIHYLMSIDAIEKSECYLCTTLLRTGGSSIYIGALITSYVSSFMFRNESDYETEISPQISPSAVFQMNTVLEEMRTKFKEDRANFRNDRELMLREQERFRQQMMSFHRQLQLDISSRQQQELYNIQNGPQFVTPAPRDQPLVQRYISPLSGHLTPRFENDNPRANTHAHVNHAHIHPHGTSAFSISTTNDVSYQPTPTTPDVKHSGINHIHSESSSAFSPVIVHSANTTGKRKRPDNDYGTDDDHDLDDVITQGKKQKQIE